MGFHQELTHYGVKGMRWGVRKKYYTPIDKPKNKTTTDKIHDDKSISKHRMNLERKYVKQGMSRDEAIRSADRRIRAEKVVAGVAGVTLAACATYGVYKYKKYTKDKILDIDTEFQTIMSLGKNQKVKTNAIQYMAYTKKDRKNYLKQYSDFLDVKNTVTDNTDNNIYKIAFKGKQQMKIASEKRARDTFTKLYNENETFKKHVNNSLNEAVKDHAGIFRSGKRADLLNEAHRIANSSKSTNKEHKNKLYDAFNFMLTLKNEDVNKSSKLFFNELSKQGVNAINDINDQKYSALVKGQNPIIKFGGEFTYTKTLLTDDPEYIRLMSVGKKWFR